MNARNDIYGYMVGKHKTTLFRLEIRYCKAVSIVNLRI